MKQVTVHTTDKDYPHFVELVKNLQYVKKVETAQNSKGKAALAHIKAGLKEVQQFKKGTLKTSSAQDFLNELPR